MLEVLQATGTVFLIMAGSGFVLFIAHLVHTIVKGDKRD